MLMRKMRSSALEKDSTKEERVMASNIGLEIGTLIGAKF